MTRSESGLRFSWGWFGSSEPELEVMSKGVMGLISSKKRSWKSHGGKPAEKAENGLSRKGSEGGRVESMVAAEGQSFW
jgi:hypothetical protein